MRTIAKNFTRLEGGWVRYDLGLDEPPWHLHATGPEDTSGEHATYPTGYDARCGMCWLGYPHTENLHRETLARKTNAPDGP